jgi:hypothetical protein
MASTLEKGSGRLIPHFNFLHFFEHAGGITMARIHVEQAPKDATLFIVTSAWTVDSESQVPQAIVGTGFKLLPLK